MVGNVARAPKAQASGRKRQPIDAANPPSAAAAAAMPGDLRKCIPGDAFGRSTPGLRVTRLTMADSLLARSREAVAED